MSCDTCKHMNKIRNGEELILHCEKDMLMNKKEVTEESIKETKCGYFVQRVEDEQLTLF